MMRRVLGLGAALAALVSFSFVGAADAQAARPKPPAPTLSRYVALGDSFASGAGLTPYSDTACARSATQAYPTLLAGKAWRLTFNACTGATTDTLGGQLTTVDGVKVVTVTIGGNDIGFAKILTDCVDSAVTDGCSPAIMTATEAALAALPGKLDTALGAVAAKYPGATVHVTGYPVMFGEFTGRCVVGSSLVGSLWINEGDASWLNGVAGRLNTALATAASEKGMVYDDVATRFDGHGRCDTGTAWVNGIIMKSSFSLTASEKSFHPTATGQKSGYAAAIDLKSGYAAAIDLKAPAASAG